MAATLLWYSGQKVWYAIHQRFWPDPEYRVVPKDSVLEWWTLHVPNFLPMLMTIELGLALWLISGKLKRTALAAGILLFASFIAMLSYEIVQDDPRPCGCSPADRAENAREVKKQLAGQIAIDTALLAAGATGLFLLRKKTRHTHLRGGSAFNP